VKNIAPGIFELRHLTALFLGNNQLQRIPPEISQLSNLTVLDLSQNKLRSLPAEIGDMVITFISLNYLYKVNIIILLDFPLSSILEFKPTPRFAL
jgi:CCR4-NOT transcription complex subunit 6